MDTPELQVPIRPQVADLPRYVPGRTLPGAAKISSNEMPFPPSHAVVEAALAALTDANRYPDLAAAPLRAALAAHIGVGQDQICVGTGSSAILLAALGAVCAPGETVVHPWRSFESYPIAVPASHAIPRPVPLLADGTHDLEGMLEAACRGARAVILCTPNNPTGPALTFTQVADFVAEVPADVLVLLDEAYIEFATAPDVRTGVPLVAEHPNVLVMRTFSKAYALAGLRVGYAVGHADLISAIGAVLVPFGVSSVAQAAAVAALVDQQGMSAAVAAVVAERDRVVGELRELGLAVPDSQSNFYWLPGLGRDFVRACAEVGLVVRPFPEGVRVSVGTPEHNNSLIEVARTFIAR
ncbi:histidinol-phosphate transaminase [Schaalia sp. 19OD2882]|uniref:histidinol-phosphate transaminase n=1 Tax=Schaalia sp. 19OD2882 TaxID=2794089 RepID=UPI001C1EB0A5|nr:histidinol-phosphate transaminase [Schaalia sp. 19OD2882]QWW19704.1 histidinol-phosphate transaminase [Schaalia sp. 19OD2882]